jgi:hypothetical protein
VVGTVTTTPGGTQAVSGTVTANQGTPAAIANAWPIKFSDGTSTVNIALPGPNLGAGMVATTGTLVNSQTFNALSAVGPGVVADFGSAKANVSMVFLGTVAAGTVVLDVSHDNSTWFQTSTPIAVTTTPQNIAVSNNAFRYARGRITATVTAGTVSATLMAS